MAAATAPAEAAPLEPSGLSPKEEGELEDGEISDDDNNGSEPASGLISTRPYSRRRPPPGLRGGASLSSSRRFPRSRHQPPPELGHLHGHGGYRPKESFRSHPPPLPSSRMPPGSHSHSDSGPRLSFWERSHNALDRFRFRGRPYRGGGRWGRSRGGGDRGSNPPGRPPGGGGGPGFSCSQGWREPSPRKCILVRDNKGGEVASSRCSGRAWLCPFFPDSDVWLGPGCGEGEWLITQALSTRPLISASNSIIP